jgi:nicotinamide phosphoribosyltransferase
MIDKFGNGLVAVVSDSYDIYNAVTNLWGDELRDKVIAMEGMLIVRPDSGNPQTVPLEVIKLLDTRFGHTLNTKGYKVLNNVRVIQGDGINRNSINAIISSLVANGYSITNIAFGMGGALLSRPERDDLGFAMKCSAICINGVWSDVFKDPITDHGKTSKKGILASVIHEGEYMTIKRDDLIDPRCNKLETVFMDGNITRNENWVDIKTRASKK